MHANLGHRVWLLCALSVLLAAVLTVAAAPASANPKYAGIVVDVNSGVVLYQEDADERRYPASLTKMMTVYIAFEELAAGRMTVDTPLAISDYAAGRPPSKIGIRKGKTIALGSAIKALVTKSANDASVVIAEAIEGSEAAFARRMTTTARRLGMASTTFRNANGLPDRRQVTTARDMAKLGIALQRDFPQYYGVFETRSFSYGKRTFGNHNRLLAMEGVDGIKTGYIRDSGFNLVTSIRRDGKHIVATVMGGRTGAARDNQMRALLTTYLPAATVGSEMLVARWQDRAPRPLPGKKPPLAEIYAARLIARAATPDPIAATLLAYAADTAGERPQIILPQLATGALEAVIARMAPNGGTLTAVAFPAPAPRGDLGEAPPPSGVVVLAELAAADTVAAYAPDALSGPEAAANLMATAAAEAVASLPSGAAGETRFELAFAGFRSIASPRRLRPEDVLAAMERARPLSGAAVGTGSRAPAPTASPVEASSGTASIEPASARANAPEAPRARTSATVEAAVARPSAATGAGGSARGGWQIQVGAVGSEREAAALLADAEARVPDVAAYGRVTVAVATDRGTFYRARFAGFGSEREAAAFCQRFTNHNRPCWAVAM